MPLQGTAELKQKLQDLRTSVPEAFAAALYEEGVAIIAKSDEEVPVEFGNLRRSHFVTMPEKGTEPKVELGYGAAYGIYVHEVPAHHPKGGKDHFLRDAFLGRMAGLQERLVARIEAKAKLTGGEIPTTPENEEHVGPRGGKYTISASGQKQYRSHR